MSSNNPGADRSPNQSARHPDLIGHVAVVVPARNEAGTIIRTVAAVEDARRQLLHNVTSSFVVVLDDCTDDTESLIRQARRRGRHSSLIVVGCSARNAGAARAVGAAAALEDARQRGALMSATWLASTDADTTVPAHWLRSQLLLADQGIDAVAGTVELERNEDPHLRHRFDEVYRFGHDGSHTHVHGANMAMRADVYLAAGGWRPLACGEDHDLWGRLREVGNCVSSTAIAVSTSARLEGRAPGGFAADLAALRQSETVA